MRNRRSKTDPSRSGPSDDLGVATSDAHDDWVAAREMREEQGAMEPSASHKSPRRRILLVVIAVLALSGLGAAAGVALPDLWTSSPEVSAVQQIIGLTIAAAGLVVGFFGVRRQWSRGLVSENWRGPLAGMKRSQRKQLTNQVRGRLPIQPGTEQLTVLQARLMIQQRWTNVVNCGLALLWIGLLVSSPALGRLVLAVLFVILVVVATPFIERDARTGEKFIAKSR